MTMVVGVDRIMLSARIGIHHHERGRRQPLVVSVALTLATSDVIGTLGQSVDYRDIVTEAEALADDHTDLIETYAQRLAERCLSLGDIAFVSVHIEKPEALPNGTASVRFARAAGNQP